MHLFLKSILLPPFVNLQNKQNESVNKFSLEPSLTVQSTNIMKRYC